MAEYIEREAALLLGYWHGEHPTIDNPSPNGVDAVDSVDIEAIPAADVQPVVRCKDCKHGTRLVCDLAWNEYIECRHGNVPHRLDWFCADGANGEEN